MLKWPVKKKHWVLTGVQNLHIWKSDWETKRGKLLSEVSGYYREISQAWLMNTKQVIYQRDNWIKFGF